MSKPRPMIDPPAAGAHPIARGLWRASGPGRAWALRDWARSVTRRDRRWRLAQQVLTAADDIIGAYRQGAHDWATLQLERLAASFDGTARELERRRPGVTKGGKKSAETRRKKAQKWQEEIRAEAKRLLSAGLTPENIGARLNVKAGRSADRVADFVRTLPRQQRQK